MCSATVHLPRTSVRIFHWGRPKALGCTMPVISSLGLQKRIQRDFSRLRLMTRKQKCTLIRLWSPISFKSRCRASWQKGSPERIAFQGGGSHIVRDEPHRFSRTRCTSGFRRRQPPKDFHSIGLSTSPIVVLCPS